MTDRTEIAARILAGHAANPAATKDAAHSDMILTALSVADALLAAEKPAAPVASGDGLVSREAAARVAENPYGHVPPGVLHPKAKEMGDAIRAPPGPPPAPVFPEDPLRVLNRSLTPAPAPVPSATGETPALPWVVRRKSDGLVLAHCLAHIDATTFQRAYNDGYAEVVESAPAAPTPVAFDAEAALVAMRAKLIDVMSEQFASDFGDVIEAGLAAGRGSRD